MKKLLILPLCMLLTACVTYYYPQTALKDGIYYAEDDPSYVVNSGGAYYPWVSLDYFYLAYYPYRYYGYYSPWYISHYHYPYNPAMQPYNSACTVYGGCHPRNRRSRRSSWDDHYAGNDRSVRSSGSRTMKPAARSRSVTLSSSNKMQRATSRQERD